MGQLCSLGTGGTSACNCQYSYSGSNTPNQTILTPVIYAETDMVRCNYGSIPTNVTSMSVAVYLPASGASSNAVTFSFNGTGVTLDTTLASSFVQPKRYQCSDVINISYLFSSVIYDPVQSENFHTAYPLDFYYTNPGGNISTYTTANVANWNCPPVLDPISTFTNQTDLIKYYSAYHVNLNLYSQAPLTVGGGSYPLLIYPPPAHPLLNGAIDRSTFYLAKQASGIFGVPVDAFVSPGVSSSVTEPQEGDFRLHPSDMAQVPFQQGLVRKLVQAME
ncbi:unnamed protein product [Sphagnum tenellum]